NFRLLLRQDSAGFSEEFTVFGENGPASVDLSHLYTGTVEGEYGSSCHGSVLQGQFEGTIHTHNDTYHIEPLDRYTSSLKDHHSIIYHEEDVVFLSWCWRFSGALDDRCDLSADCMEEYLSGRLPVLRHQSVCLSGNKLSLY
ncbi:hypothetical protein ATANTOWER_008732, partial [Ataeniobius toweri]|nr:hypothetical protein [Ataeniobius toweri]